MSWEHDLFAFLDDLEGQAQAGIEAAEGGIHPAAR